MIFFTLNFKSAVRINLRAVSLFFSTAADEDIEASLLSVLASSLVFAPAEASALILSFEDCAQL